MTETERAQTKKESTTKGQPGTDTKRGPEKFRPIMRANMTETEKEQTGKHHDRKTARHRHKERVEKFRNIMKANMTKTERAQTERQRDRRTAGHRHKEGA